MAVLEVEVAPAWREAFPGARVGMLALEGLRNPSVDTRLNTRVHEIEARLRSQYAGQTRADLVAMPTVQPYARHYRAFGQTYHVLRQLESVALKGKPLTSPSTLVLAMFAAELESLLLTAGHDLDAVQLPIFLDVSEAGERFVGIGGQEHVLRPGDMLMRDGGGIISAVIYGPDQRTRLGEATRRALFTTYAPAGIDAEAVMHHLETLEALVRAVAPEARTCALEVWPLS